MRLYVGLLFLISFQMIAQKSKIYEQYRTKYPDAHYVRLQKEKKIDIKLKEDQILITQEILEEDLYLDAAANYGSKRSINYSSFYQIQSVEATSLLYENGKYKEIEVKDFVEKDELTGSFYDDARSINFIYPGLQTGSKSKLRYTEKIKNPRFLNSFYFGSFYPIVKNKITISVDKNISLQFKEFNIDNVDIKFSKEEKRGKWIYTWEARDVDEYDLDENAPNFRNTFPHIIPIITEYKSAGKTVKLSKDVGDLYNWYYSLVKDINTEETSPELVKIVQELTKNKESSFDKVKAIYYWVQENIKYIAFEYALGGFIPREANDVYTKKYGDCKDNSSILYEMLEIANLKGNLTWIGTRSIPYKYEEVPTPVVDNHMILSYTENDKTYYLDATGRYIPIDMPTSFIQGKEALVSLTDKEFVIKKVPVIDSKRNMVSDSTYITIHDKTIKGTGRSEFSGYPKIDFYTLLETGNTETKVKEIYNRVLRKGNNRFLIDETIETNAYDYDKNFIVDYTFNIKEYIKKYDDETYINLNLNRELNDIKSKDNRKNDKEYRYKRYAKNINVLEVPDTMEVTYVPESFNIANDFFTCTIEYAQKDDKVICEQRVDLDFIKLTVDQQKELNKMIKKVEKNFKEIVILKEKK
ncbi:DUF3857 domain-containing protein [Aquimarina sp. RZ0]|uniref:DUF3857 domain-containing protein n=1 Tax=Aquimarina sp. RZ0 TaxID=2607730 RepID=UPI0011F3F57A|nr:DUF3857 domain-containing protein [Aquimarina sp. RZ0]KAA1243230.1 DUF3857 domain-containing protein [Aquimarina sp. RZ0]